MQERDISKIFFNLLVERTNKKKEEPKPVYLCAADYGEIVNLLREKGFTWPEIVLWLAEKGANFSQQGIKSGWMRWRKDQGLHGEDN